MKERNLEPEFIPPFTFPILPLFLTLIIMSSVNLAPSSHEPKSVRDFRQRNQTPDQIQEVKEQRGFIKGNTGSLVVGQAWVEAGQTKAWFRGAGRVEVGGRRG